MAAWCWSMCLLCTMLVCSCTTPVLAQPPSPLLALHSQSLPATAVGERVRRLLDAYNANDSAALVRVVRDDYSAALRGGSTPEAAAVRWHEIFSSYGPIVVDSVTASTEVSLRLWARGTITRAWIEFLVAADTAAPHLLTRVGLGRGLKPPFARAVALPGRELAAIGAYVDRLAGEDRFSGVVVVAKDGRVVLERRHGFANAATRTRHDAETRFSLASTGKLFTATAIALLARDGRLRLTDTIGRYLPELPAQVAGRITIGQLLTHTSGLGELGAQFDTVRFARARDYLPLFRDTTLAFAPGTSSLYSNRGYIILGAVIEAVTGRRYDAYLANALFRPLGMRHTAFVAPTELSRHDAVGYTRFPTVRGGFVSGPRRANTAIMERGSPAGGIYSSSADLVRFAEALRTNRFGTLADSVFSMRTAERYGLMISPERRAFGHGGAHPGVSTNVQIFPGSGHVVVMLSNYDIVTNHIAAFVQDVFQDVLR